jgi:G3E family GTPase
VLNKADLVSDAELEAIERRVRSMKAVATVLRATDARVPHGEVLDVGGFTSSAPSRPSRASSRPGRS